MFNLAQFGWTPNDIFWETSYQSLVLMLSSSDDRKKIQSPDEAESAMKAFFGVDVDAG